MKKLLTFQTMRQLLALSALVVVGLLIWFVGPPIAFGGLKPLAGVGMRILAIALLLTASLLWLAGLSTSIVFVVLLCLLIWYATPSLAFGHAQPFEAESARGLAIAVVLSVVAIYWLVRLWKRMRSDNTFRSRVLEFGGKEKESPAASQIEEVTEIAATAISRLRSMRTGGQGLSRLFQGKRYLYELPWYIMLGSKGAGKTVGVLNAGFSFPVAEQMQQAVRELAGGVSTAHVDWWLTNDAVLIDTAGNYTQHRPTSASTSTSPAPGVQATTDANEPDAVAGVNDRGAEVGEEKPATHTPITASAASITNKPINVDAAEWLGFLGLLRKHRPRAPLNGAILAVDLTELTSDDKHVRLAQAAALRARLAEMRTELGIRFPVYLVITKMDRLTGFSEYFGSLTAEGRSQTWGFTLPHGREVIAKEGVRARCLSELGLLEMRLSDGINTRLQDDYNPEKRKRLAVLSEEFSGLTRPLIELIESVFLDSRYDTTQVHSTLRGVYFTSAAQTDSAVVAERNTLVQRLWRTLDRRPDAPANTEPGHHSYFLHDLLTKVVFREAHLVRPNLRWEFRFRLLRLVGHALALLIFAWLAIGLRISFGTNHEY